MFATLSAIALILAGACLIGLSLLSLHVKQVTSVAEPSRPPGKGDPLEQATLHPGIYGKIVLATVLAIVALTFLSYGLWHVMLFDIGEFGFNLGFPLMLLPMAYVAVSVHVVPKDERGALYFYGIALKNVGPGPQFVPRFLVNLETRPIDIQRIEEPGPRDKIFWGDEKEPLPDGMVRPIFVTARSQLELPTGEDAETAPLDVQMQYGVGYFIFWSVSNDVATFLQNSRTIEEASSQLKMASLTLLDQIIGTRTTEGVIAKQAEVNGDFVSAMCEQAVGMGVRIHSVGLQGINLSHDMATAMRDRAKAKFEAESLNIKTDAEARRTRELGEADGDADYAREKRKLEGRAEGMQSIMKNLEVTGDAVLASVTIQEGWPKSTVIAGAGPGTADLAAAVKTVAATFGGASKEG